MSDFEVDYRRDSGIHTFQTFDETPVTAIAAPDWKTYVELFGSLPPSSGYIVSPELITSPCPIGQLKDHADEISDRVETVRALSQNHKEALVLLGTATLSDDGLMRNSLLAIRSGHIEGYVDKRGTMCLNEAVLFSQPLRPQTSLLKVGHSALICSDLVTASFESADELHSRGLLSSDTKTALVSACWAIPRSTTTGVAVSYEERFRTALEKTITRLFAAWPALAEVVMVDRSIVVSGVAPYNAHFKRSTNTHPLG